MLSVSLKPLHAYAVRGLSSFTRKSLVRGLGTFVADKLHDNAKAFLRKAYPEILAHVQDVGSLRVSQSNIDRTRRIPLPSIFSAQGRLEGLKDEYGERVISSPKLLEAAPRIRQMVEAEHERRVNIWFQTQGMQRTGAYKILGASNFMMQYVKALLERGGAAASAGNHSQGVALMSRILKVHCVIVMPESTPSIKVMDTETFGSGFVTVIRHGKTFQDSLDFMMQQFVRQEGRLFIPPYDHTEIMAGAGTIGLNILNDCNDVDMVLGSIGGGGLMAGIGSAIKHHNENVRVIGAEPAMFPSTTVALQQNAPTEIPRPSAPSIADGASVCLNGERTFEVLPNVLDRMYTIPDPLIKAGVRMIFERQGLKAEGAAAMAFMPLFVPGFFDGVPDREEGTNVVVVLSGRNIDTTAFIDCLTVKA